MRRFLYADVLYVIQRSLASVSFRDRAAAPSLLFLLFCKTIEEVTGVGMIPCQTIDHTYHGCSKFAA